MVQTEGQEIGRDPEIEVQSIGQDIGRAPEKIDTVREIRDVGKTLAIEISDKIATLYNFMNENYEDCFDFEKTESFPIYDFELRNHYDTYKGLAERLEKDFPADE